ncbi:MAG TPA: tetratricopeptide repeat protein [Methylophilaceae bacterium]|nr:tetratricopeptide repeat protein [Methylophilaceae bacterium]HAJ71474.1 tetratricopeptide repeat protein [Methylophilaceae bacterium]
MLKFNKLLLTLLLATNANLSFAESNSSIKPKITEANAEFVYKYLLGEIAGERGEYLLAGQLFLDLAQQTRDPRLAERAAKTAAYAKQGALALKASTLWVELDPSSVEAQQAASQLLVASGNLKAAKPQIAKLLAKEDTRANGFLYLNSLLAKQEDKKEVLALIQELAKPYPAFPEAHFAIAQAAYMAENLELSKAELAIADKYRPGWEVSAQMQGQILFKESPDKAIAFYKSFLQQHPNANDVRMAYAKVLVNQKKFQEAKPEFIKLAYSAKGKPEISVVVGLLSLESDDPKMADQYFEQALKDHFKEPNQVYLYLGRSAEKQNNNMRAMMWYNKIESGNFYLDGRISAANIIAKNQSVDAAITMLDAVDDLTPEQQVAVIQAENNLLSQAKRDQESFNLMQKAVNTFPDASELIYDYAMTAERVNKLDIMETELYRLIKIRPDFAPAYNALGYSFADRNIKLTEAKTLIETAFKLSPNDHYILDSLGWVYYRLGDLPNAVSYLRKAYDVQPDPEIAAHLGEVLWQQGQQEEAKKIWGQALKSFPENDTLLSTTKKFKS